MRKTRHSIVGIEGNKGRAKKNEGRKGEASARISSKGAPHSRGRGAMREGLENSILHARVQLKKLEGGRRCPEKKWAEVDNAVLPREKTLKLEREIEGNERLWAGEKTIGGEKMKDSDVL